MHVSNYFNSLLTAVRKFEYQFMSTLHSPQVEQAESLMIYLPMCMDRRFCYE